MRVEPYTIGDFVHVYNCGNRKMPIVYDEDDKWRWLKILRYFNDENSSHFAFRRIMSLHRFDLCKPFEWPKSWPLPRPLVKILAYHLATNHFHLLLKEIVKGGVSKFMKKLGDGFTGYINVKYNQVGRLFQGSYKAKLPKGKNGLPYLDAYIQVFNPFELYPGGIKKALKDFDKAFEFALNYPFCSLGETFGKRNLGIIDRDVLREMFPNLKAYKEFAYDALMIRNIREVLGKSTID